MQEVFHLGGVEVSAGTRVAIDLPITDLSTHTPITMPVVVAHGRNKGPRLFVCAALHGDEINGVEIIRRLLQLSGLKRLRGTLIAVPVVNVLGFLSQSPSTGRSPGHSRVLSRLGWRGCLSMRSSVGRRTASISIPVLFIGTTSRRFAAIWMIPRPIAWPVPSVFLS
jgi:hypothetical protein